MGSAAGEKYCNLAELLVYAVSSGEENPVVPFPAIMEPGQVPVSIEMITAANSITWDGGGLPALIDGDNATYWHSDYWYAITTNDPEYGLFFDIALASPLQDFHFEYVVRQGNSGAKPTHVLVGVSDDGETWTQVGDFATDAMQNATAGSRVVLDGISADAPYSFIRFGIADSANGDEGSLTGDLNFEGYKKCANLAELKLFED